MKKKKKIEKFFFYIYDENNNIQILNDNNKIDVGEKINDNFKINDMNFEILKIRKVKQILNYTTKNSNKIYRPLNDARLLSYNYYFSYKIEEEKLNVNEIKVYNIVNNTLDITFNLDKKINEIKEIIIMIDGNAILKGDKITIIKVHEKSIEIIDSIETSYNRIFKFSNDFIAVYQYSSINFYEYEQGILIESNYKINIKEIIYEICEVNKNEIAIYCYENGILYGRSDFLIFYGIKSGKQITSFKIGEGKSKKKFLRLINKKTIILQHETIFYLIDAIQREIKKTIDLYSDNLSTFILIDEYYFLLKENNDTICQYEIDSDNKPKFIDKKRFGSFDYFMQFPGNKLLLVKDEKNISIYG